MIALLEGTLVERGEGGVVVLTGGVGYEVFCSSTTLSAIGSPAPPGESGPPVRLFTYLHVREDAMQLYGFADREERTLFLMLIGVSGVGPKVALAMLSALSPDSFRTAVAAEDAARLSSVPGIGKKTAERVIVELKDKLGAPDGVAVGKGIGAAASSSALEEARQALLSLGYSSTEIRLALAEIETDGRSTEDLVTAALRRLGG